MPVREGNVLALSRDRHNVGDQAQLDKGLAKDVRHQTFSRCDMCHRPPGRLAGGAREHRGRLPPGGRDGGRHGRARRPPDGRRRARGPPRRPPGRRPGGRRDASRRAAGRTCPTSTPRSTPARAWRSTSRSRTTRTSRASSPTDALADDVAAALAARGDTDRVVVISSLRTAPASTAAGGRVAADRHRLAGDGPAAGRRRGRRGRRPRRRCTRGGRRVDQALVERRHAAGIAVNIWTCDDPERWRELIGWGVDGICTNVPDVAIARAAAERAAGARQADRRSSRSGSSRSITSGRCWKRSRRVSPR